jgi:hypothetical protein
MTQTLVAVLAGGYVATAIGQFRVGAIFAARGWRPSFERAALTALQP